MTPDTSLNSFTSRLSLQAQVVLVCLATATFGTSAAALKCAGRVASPLCVVSAGPLSGDCPTGASSVAFKFTGPDASWPSDSGGLSSCDSVTHLKVTGWKGPELESGHLRQLGSRLVSADIVDGGLETLGSGVTTKQLTELSLARNKIASVHALFLAECDSLTSLDLSDNSIDHLPNRLLINCRSLRSLRLSGNLLTELRSDVLLGATQLREIVLLKNRFQMLNKVEQAFVNSPKLGLIELRNNDFFSYQAGRSGFCGPQNVTVRMHFAGCPPETDDCVAASRQQQRHDCVGSSAQLVVTFTSCQVSVTTARCRPEPTCPPAQQQQSSHTASSTASSAKSQASPSTTSSPQSTPELDSQVHQFRSTDERRLLEHLGFRQDATWPIYALAVTVVYAVLQLIVSLAVCHRLKLRLARLQVRAERLAEECPSHRYFQHPTLCSHSGLSGRLTPSGKGPSSHCGFSAFEETTPTPPPPRPPVPPPAASGTQDDGETAAGAEQPLRMQEDE